ncbi:hypothetical protein O0L34_g416 [Tuta absoluta]|nr:hypothetical protein O0L34_g416 [Tuta absoluta]
MACGKVVLFLLAITASVSCAPTEKNLNSSREDSSSEREPPPYHQSPMNDTQAYKNRHCEHHHHMKTKANRLDPVSDLQNSSSSIEESKPSSQEILQASSTPRNVHHDFHGNHASLPPSDLNGSNKSSPLLFQVQQIFDTFITGLGVSNNTGFPNIISVFLPHSTRSQRIELPDNVAVENNVVDNSTQDPSRHDRIFFSLINSFLQSFFGGSNLFQNTNSNVAIGCNFTTQAGYSCSGCREQLICNPNNIGTIRICPRNNPYCYNGVCGQLVNTTACTTTTTTTV